MTFPNELELTNQQEKRRKSIERRLQKALRDFHDLAVEVGCEDPYLYYECEGVLCAFDFARCDPGAGSTGQRQGNVLLSVSIYSRHDKPGTVHMDCGAW